MVSLGSLGGGGESPLVGGGEESRGGDEGRACAGVGP